MPTGALRCKALRALGGFGTARFGLSSRRGKCNLHSTRAQQKDENEALLSLPRQYLRALDFSNYDPVTSQRNDVAFDVKTGKPILSSGRNALPTIEACKSEADEYIISWSDGKLSKYDKQLIERAVNRMNGSPPPERVLWTGLEESFVRSDVSVTYDEILWSSRTALEKLYQYGILFVPDTPTDEVSIAALGAALGGGTLKSEASLLHSYSKGTGDTVLPHGTDGPMRTLYGTVWSTTTGRQAVGGSVADSAYGCDGLPLHTDLTYYRDPPGLQIFTMVQPAIRGGESVFADGFAVAEHLRKLSPISFDVLSRTVRTFRCVDKTTGWHLEARGPVISVDEGQVIGIRHNDLDRLPDLPPQGTEQVDLFYSRLEEAHQALDSVLAQDETRLTMQLRPGETMVVANQRCFHGRHSFETTTETPRCIIGCYVSQDELYSRFRMEGFDVL